MTTYLRSMMAVCLAASMMCTPGPVAGQEPFESSAVAARIDGQPLYAREIESHMAELLNGRQLDPDAAADLRSRTLEQLIDRRLILIYLSKKQLGASSDDISLAVNRIKKELAAQSTSLPDYLAEAQTSIDEFRMLLAWQIGWPRYLQRYLTDENFERYFDQHRSEFDGSQVRAAHMLLKIADPSDAEQQRRTIEQAARIRQQIAENEISFAEAATRYSQAPTADQGGDVGLISRHKPMPEAFSKAAFELKVGETSQPVVTHFGVHLVHCLAKKPGSKAWRDARGELRPAMVRFLFRWTADQQRPKSKIEISSEWQTGAATN